MSGLDGMGQTRGTLMLCFLRSSGFLGVQRRKDKSEEINKKMHKLRTEPVTVFEEGEKWVFNQCQRASG